MKMKHCFAMLGLSLVVINSSFAQTAQKPEVYRVQTEDPDVSIPMVIDALPAAPEADYVTKFRKELLRLQMEEHEKNPTGKVTLHRFTKESALFFVAIAAVQMQSLIVEYSDNPSAMLQHFESLEDPIAHISFYLFMRTQHSTVNFLQKGLKQSDPLTYKAAMTRIGYLGMSAASLVSGLSAEILTGLRDCSKAVYFPNKNPEKQNEAMGACDAAHKSWTLNKKVQQYIPQIVSLLASTEAAKYGELGLKKGFSMTGEALGKALAAKKGSIFKFAAFQIATTANPAGITVKGFSILGKIIQFAGFTYLDHAINPYVQKLFGNTFKPMEFAYDINQFQKTVEQARGNDWTLEKENVAVAKRLKDITDLMTDWRMQQLNKFNIAHSVWGENTLRIIEHTNITKEFYQSYLENVFATLKTGYQIKTGKLEPTAIGNITYYPFRTLPLYGIRLLRELPKDYSAATDLYLEKPAELEGYQLETVKEAGNKFKQLIADLKLNKGDLQFANEVEQTFAGRDTKAIGALLAKINAITEGQFPSVGKELRDVLRYVRAYLGDPRPILTQGLAFSYAYSNYSYNTEALAGFDPHDAGQFKDQAADYLWLKMACGENERFYTNVWGMAPKFYQPKLVKKDISFGTLCAATQGQSARDYRGNKVLQGSIYDTLIMANNGKTYQGINDAIYQNLRPEILGDYTKDDGQLEFANWWNENVNTPMIALFKVFDKDYMNVLVNLTDNWQKPPTYLDKINQSKYLGKDVLENLSFELNLYASVLTDILQDPRENRNRSPLFDIYNLGNANAAPPTIQMIAANTPGRLEDPKGMFTRFKESSLADQNARKLADEATRLRAAANAAKANFEKMKLAQTKGGGSPSNAAFKIFQESTDKAIVAAEKAEKAALQARRTRFEKDRDTTLVRGQNEAKFPELTALVESLRIRLDLLRKVKVTRISESRYETQNFPEKKVMKDALKQNEEAMKSLAEMLTKLEETPRGQRVATVASAAINGIQSVTSEVGRLTMALYTSKYALGDLREDIEDRRASRTKKPQKNSAIPLAK